MKKIHCKSILEALRITEELLTQGKSAQVKQYSPDSIWVGCFKAIDPDQLSMVPFIETEQFKRLDREEL